MNTEEKNEDQTPKAKKAWESFLNPAVLRGKLIAATIFIATFESLKDAIISRPRDFYWNGFDKSEDKISPGYQTNIMIRNKSPLYASMAWLKDEMQAINDDDVAIFEAIKNCRNTLTHKLLDHLGYEGLPTDFEQNFVKMVELLRKIEVWWIANIEIPTNPDICDSDPIDYDGIVPGKIMIVQLLCDIALGDDSKSMLYYEEFCRRFGNSPEKFQEP